MPSLDTLARQRLVMDYRPRVIAKPVRRSSDDAAERLYRAMLADLRSEIEIERADRYNIRTPAGMRAGKSRGGQFRSLSSAVIGALEAWINGEGDDDPLESFTDDQLRKAARQLDVEVPRGTSRARLKLALLQKARDDVRAQRREANDARQAMPEGYRVERLEGGRWSVQREGEPGFAEADTIAEARRLAEADRDRRTAQATRKRLEELRLPGGPAPAPRPRREQTFRPAPDTPTRRPAVPASERASRDEVMRRIQQAMDDPQMRSRLADMVAAGTVSWDSALEMLTGRADPAATDPGRMAPETTLPFVHGMVHAGYVTELAWTGDRSRVERYLRRQNTSTLHTIAPFFGVNLPGDATHSRAVAEIADQAMRLEAPRGPEVPVLSGEELRQSLMSRKVKDLQASLRAAGLPVSGRKAELVDRLMAAYGAVRGDRDDAADRADRARPAGRRDGRGRSRGAAAAQPADSEPDAPTAGPVGAGVGGGDPAGDLTGAEEPVTLAGVRAEGDFRDPDTGRDYRADAQRELDGGRTPMQVADYLNAAARDVRARSQVGQWRPGDEDPYMDLAYRLDRLALRLRTTDPERQEEESRRRAALAAFDRLSGLTGSEEWRTWAGSRARDAAREAFIRGEPVPEIVVELRRVAESLERRAGSGLVSKVDLMSVLKHDEQERRLLALADARRLRAMADSLAVGQRDGVGDLTGAGGLSPDPDVRAVQVENRIRQAYRDLPKAPGGWVGLADLREYWQGWDHSRADFDAAIRRLARDPDWRAVPVDNRKALTERDRASAVRVGEDDVHVIAYAPGGRPAAALELRPLSDTSSAQPARAASALPSASPGRVSVSDSRDWTPAQHVAHAEQARQAGDEAEARLHRSLADRKNRQIVESGRGVEHLRSLADRDDARRFLRSLTRDQLNDLAAQLGVDTAGSRDAVIDRILAQLFGG